MKNKFVKFLKIKKVEPYIIAEIGSNHNGDIKLCEKQIKLAAEAGAHAVKFQKFDEKNIFSEESYNKNKLLKKSDVRKFSVDLKFLKTIEKLCKKYQVDFGITPLSYNDVDLISKNLNISFFKVASGDANNINFLNYIAKKKKPTVISFGMCTEKEIQNSVKNFYKINKKLAIMYCVSIYPTPINKINLNRIVTLKKMFKKLKVGFSDHSLGIDIALASFAIGSEFIEKHFTSNKKLKGWDHSMSLDYGELKNLCAKSTNITNALGDYKINRVEDKNALHFFRRSIVLNKNLKKGHKISIKDLDYKRPGYGIDPNEIQKVIGKKLRKNKKFDELLYFKDLKR